MSLRNDLDERLPGAFERIGDPATLYMTDGSSVGVSAMLEEGVQNLGRDSPHKFKGTHTVTVFRGGLDIDVQREDMFDFDDGYEYIVTRIVGQDASTVTAVARKEEK